MFNHFCTIFLFDEFQYWICKKTNIINPIKGREEETPGIVKWDLDDLNLKLKHYRLEDFEVKKQNKI